MELPGAAARSATPPLAGTTRSQPGNHRWGEAVPGPPLQPPEAGEGLARQWAAERSWLQREEAAGARGQQTWKKDFVLELTPEHSEIVHHEVCSAGMAQNNYLAIHSSSSFCNGSSQCHALRGTFGKIHG